MHSDIQEFCIVKARQTILAEIQTYGNLFSRENIRERMFVEQVKILRFLRFFFSFFFRGMKFLFFFYVSIFYREKTRVCDFVHEECSFS